MPHAQAALQLMQRISINWSLPSSGLSTLVSSLFYMLNAGCSAVWRTSFSSKCRENK